MYDPVVGEARELLPVLSGMGTLVPPGDEAVAVDAFPKGGWLAKGLAVAGPVMGGAVPPVAELDLKGEVSEDAPVPEPTSTLDVEFAGYGGRVGKVHGDVELAITDVELTVTEDVTK